MTRPFEELVAVARAPGLEARTLSREECLEATRDYATDRRNEIRRRHEQGESGTNVVLALSETADNVLNGIFRFGLAGLAVPRSVMSRVCLCALGGYGREELSPASDLDVCLLYEGKLLPQIEDLNNFLVPFLWDTGFVVGYAIRSVKDSRQLAKDDIRAFTSLLEGRFICGESSVFARMKLIVRELQADTWAKAFEKQKMRDRLGGLPDEHADLFAPEPNVKESAGGLRDFHTALWLLMMSYGVNSLDEAVAQGLIAPEEQLEFAQALDFVWRIRNELHFHTGTAQDRLTFKHQKHLAEAFGYRSEQQSGVLQFMQEYYGAASRLRRFLSITARVCDYPAPPSIADAAGAPRDLVIEEGQLFAGLGDPAWFAHEPARLMRVYWESARHGARISRSTERLVTQHLHLVGDTFHASDLVRRFFIAVCNRPTSAGAVLRDMANSGLLGRYFPEFSEIRGVLRYADFHHYPVDEHTLLAVESLARIPDLGGPVGGCLRESLENLSDPYIVVMAILFHDLGKAAGEVHVQESVERTRAICQRIGMPEEDTERIAFLVQHHMLMNNISQFRDTDDEHIVQSFANTVKTDQRLRGLLLLSFADLYAVGPNVWNDWKGTLLLQLYLKTVKRLLGRAETVGEEFWKAEKARRVVEATRDDIKNQVEDHLRGLGQRYFVAFTPDRIATHLACVAEARKTGLCVWSALNGGDRHGEVVICTRDRHGLFSELAGTFAAQLIDVNSAALFTRPDGYVVDCFTVTDARQRRAPTRRQLAKVERILREVLLHGDSIQDYVDRSRRRLFALLQPRIPVPTRIQFDNESSRIHTVIDIETGDRTGLLYDITRAMAEAGLNITAARVVTDARRVRDSFYVHKNHNRILDEEERETVRASIHNAIHPRSTAESKGDAR